MVFLHVVVCKETASKRERILFFPWQAALMEQAKKEAIKQINAMKTPFELTIISCSNQSQVLLNSRKIKKSTVKICKYISKSLRNFSHGFFACCCL